jgi:hypothetical protein
MKGLLTVLLLFFVTSLLGQGFTYSYVDPCSKKLKTLYINNNQNVTINYLGQTNSFTQQDFTSGAFDNWISTVQSQASSSPCDEIMTYQQTFQNMVITQNLISTLTSVNAVSTMSMSNVLGNSVNNASSSKSSKRDKQKSNTNGTTISNNTSSGNVQTNPTTQSGTSNNGGNQNSSQSTSGGSNQTGETSSENSGNTPNTNNPSQGGSGQTEPSVNSPNQGSNNTQSGTNSPQTGSNNTQSGTNTGQNTSNSGSNSGKNEPNSGKNEPKSEENGGFGGTTNSISNSSSNSKVKVGTVIGTGDIVAIRSNEDGSNQFKGTMSVTKANTNNTLAKGALLTFTTSINNSNLTFYGAFTNKKKTNVLIVANSSMLDFDKNFFNTTTALESKKFGKVNLMAGANFTIGGLYGESFSNLSVVGGGFIPFQVSKNVSGNLLLLGVYSPFTKFYEGRWWNSGLLLVPFSSWDYTISKNFKYNISISGTYEMKGNVLQYQILTGGKILL